MKTFLALLIATIVTILVIIAKQPAKPPPHPDYVAGARLYEWGKKENLHKPQPDVYEFKMGSYPNREDEHKYSTFRIEKEFTMGAPNTWGYPIRLAIPLSVLDKKQTAEQYIQNYENAKSNTYQVFFVTLNPASHENIPRDKNNWQSLIGSDWYALEYNLRKANATCTAKWDSVHRYHYCDLYHSNKVFSQKRYYWTSNPHNTDPLMQMPIIFRCYLNNLDTCTIMIPYNHNTDLLMLKIQLDTPLINPTGGQYNPFLYADYMPKIIQFIKEREVVNPEAIHEQSASGSAALDNN